MTELEALRRVAEAARKWQHSVRDIEPRTDEECEAYEAFDNAIHALDALPAPAAEGETVEVRADVFLAKDGIIAVREQGYMLPALTPSHIATIRARIPLSRVHEVMGEVE